LHFPIAAQDKKQDARLKRHRYGGMFAKRRLYGRQKKETTICTTGKNMLASLQLAKFKRRKIC
jgi:hypothetical protein